MVIVTSLAPHHKNKDAQMRAVESWKKTGYRIISVNHKEEIESLYQYDVEFVIPEKTGIQTFGRHYVPVSELLKVIQNEGSGLILNSDIIIDGLPDFKDYPVIFNRYDFETDIKKAQFFKSGFDGFYLTAEHCNLPESKLCLGQCHWDYWLPVMLLQKGYKLRRPVKPYLFHVKHQLQYGADQWQKTANIFSQETGIRGTPSQISQKAFNFITSQIIPI